MMKFKAQSIVFNVYFDIICIFVWKWKIQMKIFIEIMFFLLEIRVYSI